jgi:polysaccharide export outer membrane protein
MPAQFLSPAPTAPVNTADQRLVDPVLLKALLNAPYPKSLLMTGDVVNVRVYGVKEFDVMRTVSSNGVISLPLIGDVPAAGSSIEELERAINEQLVRAGMLIDPHATVTAQSQPSRVVTVSGEVTKPGIFPANGQLTLMDYLSVAGGLGTAAFQASPVITLVRPSLSAPVSIPLGPDPRLSPYARIPIFSGDEIRVGRIGFVYAAGAFRTQGAYQLKQGSPTYVSQLVALAGGIGYEAESGSAHIVRATPSGPVLISINVTKILRGKAPDVPLEANDIVFVPTNDIKAAIKGGGTGIVAGFATAYIYKF